jgi:hypothetical protein
MTCANENDEKERVAQVESVLKEFSEYARDVVRKIVDEELMACWK